MAGSVDWLDLCDQVDNGDFDAGLDEIARAIQGRREVVARRNARRLLRSLQVGDRVVIVKGANPRYLEGMVGTVKEIRENGAAVVHLDKMPTPGRGRPSNEGLKQNILVPLTFLQKIDADTTSTQDLDPDDIGDDSEDDDEDGDDDDDDD